MLTYVLGFAISRASESMIFMFSHISTGGMFWSVNAKQRYALLPLLEKLGRCMWGKGRAWGMPTTVKHFIHFPHLLFVALHEIGGDFYRWRNRSSFCNTPNVLWPVTLSYLCPQSRHWACQLCSRLSGIKLVQTIHKYCILPTFWKLY